MNSLAELGLKDKARATTNTSARNGDEGTTFESMRFPTTPDSQDCLYHSDARWQRTQQRKLGWKRQDRLLARKQKSQLLLPQCLLTTSRYPLWYAGQAWLESHTLRWALRLSLSTDANISLRDMDTWTLEGIRFSFKWRNYYSNTRDEFFRDVTNEVKVLDQVSRLRSIQLKRHAHDGYFNRLPNFLSGCATRAEHVR